MPPDELLDTFINPISPTYMLEPKGKLKDLCSLLVELIITHKFDISVEYRLISKKDNDDCNYYFTALVVKTSNKDHINIFTVLGRATGLFQVDQIDSLVPTEWWYQVTPTAQ